MASPGRCWRRGARFSSPSPPHRRHPPRLRRQSGRIRSLLSIVQEFVRKAHTDLAATQSLLEEQPGLLNATWDWGGGDFEMGIGGAGHMGNREIAEFLISKGGRLDVFVAAMLGRLEIVKAYLAAFPALVESKGPHGISLMRHAVAGGSQAEPVAEFLRSVGAR